MRTRFFFFFSSRRRHTRCLSDWSSDVCSSDLVSCDTQYVIAEVSDIWRVNTKPAVTAGLKRSEERRVGKECRSRGSRYHLKKKRIADGRSQRSDRSEHEQHTHDAEDEIVHAEQ